MKERLAVRLELCEGHWQLGEREEAVLALERARTEAPDHAGIRLLAARLRAELPDDAGPELSERLERLCGAAARARPARSEEQLELPALATSTLAELLAAQGHEEKALQVALDVLRRDPNDERATAVRVRIERSEPGERPQASERPKPSERSQASDRPRSSARERAVRERTVHELEHWLENLERWRARRLRTGTARP